MKVYIVVAGCYSDFHIERVFLDKEKAKRYVELSQDSYEPPYIKEMETSDEQLIEKITYIDASYTKDSYWSDHELEIEIRTTNTLDSSEEHCNSNTFYKYSGKEKYLHIERVIKGDYNEELLKSKYEKVCYDLMSKIESLLEIEGWDEKMIQEWLNQNADNYVKN